MANVFIGIKLPEEWVERLKVTGQTRSEVIKRILASHFGVDMPPHGNRKAK